MCRLSGAGCTSSRSVPARSASTRNDPPPADLRRSSGEAKAMIPDKPATASVPIHELLARRWSPRAFDPKRPVSGEQIISLLEAARWAPSRFGDEPYRFLVWDKSVDPDGWKRVFDCLAESNRPWVANAPLLILACASFLFRHNGKPSRWGPHDTGAASMALV